MHQLKRPRADCAVPDAKHPRHWHSPCVRTSPPHVGGCDGRRELSPPSSDASSPNSNQHCRGVLLTAVGMPVCLAPSAIGSSAALTGSLRPGEVGRVAAIDSAASPSVYVAILAGECGRPYRVCGPRGDASWYSATDLTAA
eukprot:TRINITY_DN26130_c0_g1_i1.p1 TRINITY_DN26130_c0_g1~~TRINITY_DN26130_c0_g1_i1.p1  ORF type:complete len:141 (+),score=23.34 TRINITY_DN26130_c0_g1_i1:53-475(+)